MPGLFRISLPPGWQRTEAPGDSKVIAAFSKGDLTAKIRRDTSSVPADNFARSVTNRLPQGSNDRIDEYLMWGGLPSQRTEYSDCAGSKNDTAPKEHCERVRALFTLSPGEYWVLEIRGFKDPYLNQSAEHDSGFGYSFELLEPVRSRVRVLIPDQAWTRMAASTGLNLLGIASGIGLSESADSYWLQGRREFPRPQDASALALVGQEVLEQKCASDSACPHGHDWYVLQHFVGNLSAEAFTDYVQNGQKEKGVSYSRYETHPGTVDGFPGTGIVSTRTKNKGGGLQIVITLTVSSGVDHFAVQHVIAPICDEFDEDEGASCNGFSYHPDFNRARLFALYPKIQAASSVPEEAVSLPHEVAVERRRSAIRLKFNAAVYAGDLPWTKALLEESPDLPLARDLKFDRGFTSLHIAAAQGNTGLLKLLLTHDADINAKTDDGWTPLHSAAFSGKKEAVELLLASGADVNAKSSSGETPLLQAAQKGYTDVVKLLLARSADVNAKSGDGCTALHRVAFVGDNEAAKLILAKKAEVDARSLKGETPLLQAVQNGHIDLAQLLLAHGADINAGDNGGSTPLHAAAHGKNRDMMELLIAHNADVNKSDPDGWTPLHTAAANGGKEIAELLLAHKADVNAKTRKGMTPLASAACNGYKDLAEALIAHNADVNAKDNAGFTPLAFAAFFGHENTVKLLLTRNADVNARDNDGGSALSSAVIKGRKEVAELLLAHGADVHAKDTYGNTDLHLAESVEMADLLIAHGADVNARNRKGFTPLALALAKHDENIARLLQQHGGRK